MVRQPFLSIITAALALTVAPAARGELPQLPQSIARHHGIGWSDGYHSRAACPPKKIVQHRSAAVFPASTPKSAPVPWWKIPPAPTEPAMGEPLPAPAAKEAAPTRFSTTSGPSLFRQPGEGSSVAAPSGVRF